jgi:hypothetical protein
MIFEYRVLECDAITPNQLKDRVSVGYFCKRCRVGTCSQRKIPLDGQLEPIEIGLQDLRFLLDSNDPNAKLLSHAPSFENDFARTLGITDPLRASSGSDQKAPLLELKQIDWSRIYRPVLRRSITERDREQCRCCKRRCRPNVVPGCPLREIIGPEAGAFGAGRCD